MGGPQPAPPTPPDRATAPVIALGKLSRQLLRPVQRSGAARFRGGRPRRRLGTPRDQRAQFEHNWRRASNGTTYVISR